ncbi:MAG: hypothetical protein ACK4FL_01385 [Microgenomates group bacterium]
MKKSKIVTILLLAMTIILMVGIFYIAALLTNNFSENSSPVITVKTKAQSKTYSRTIAFNISPSSSSPSPTLTPTPILSPTAYLTPTPTEIILAYNNPSPTGNATVSATVTETPSISPTKPISLPDTGYISNALILFATAAFFIFFAFIF